MLKHHVLCKEHEGAMAYISAPTPYVYASATT